jgi:hypothetical protein
LQSLNNSKVLNIQSEGSFLGMCVVSTVTATKNLRFAAVCHWQEVGRQDKNAFYFLF